MFENNKLSYKISPIKGGGVLLSNLRIEIQLIQSLSLPFKGKTMPKIYKIYFLPLLLFFNVTFSQILEPNDSLLYAASIKNALNRGIKNQKSINIGVEYIELPYSIRNDHPFFLSSIEQNGEVTYNHILYKEIGLQYDLVKDELVVENFSGRKIILVKEKVSEFVIEGHVFKNADGFNPKLKISGYYEILIDEDNVKLLAKRIKRVKGQLANQLSYRKADLQIEYTVKYFLMKDENYFQVKNQNAVSKILMTGREKVRIRSKKLTREASMIAIVNLYKSQKK